jgi:hypothetical protein
LLTGQQFVDQGASSTGVCQAATQQSVTYASWLVRYNELTRPGKLNMIQQQEALSDLLTHAPVVSVFSAAGCSGSSVTVSPSTAINTCFNVQIGSGKF